MEDLQLEAILEGAASLGEVPPGTFTIIKRLAAYPGDDSLVVDVYYNGRRINIAAGPSRIGESTYENISRDMWNRVHHLLKEKYPQLDRADRDQIVETLSSRLVYLIKSNTSSKESELKATAELVNVLLNEEDELVWRIINEVVGDEINKK